MKPNIHPAYHNQVSVTCACGNSFETGSTTPSIQVEICANCHPFFTGKSHMIDTAGRVDKFKARVEQAKTLQTKRVKQRAKPVVKPISEGTLVETASETLKEKHEK